MSVPGPVSGLASGLVSRPASGPASVPVLIPAWSNVTVVSFASLSPNSKVSPWQLDQFKVALRCRPDESAVAYVISFPTLLSVTRVSSNMRGSSEDPSVIDSYLQNGVYSGMVAGPFPVPPLPFLHISRFGVILKNNQPGKWPFVWDLTSPRGAGCKWWHPWAPVYSSECFSRCLHWWHNDSGSRNINGQVWRGRSVQMGGGPPGWSPSSWHEVALAVFCGFGTPIWAAFSTIHLYRHCRFGWMDSGSKLWCHIPLSLLGRFRHLGTTGLPCLLQQLSNLCSVVWRTWPTTSSR